MTSICKMIIREYKHNKKLKSVEVNASDTLRRITDHWACPAEEPTFWMK